MNNLNEQQLEVQIPVVAWLLIVLNAIVLLVALGIFALMIGAGTFVRDPDAEMILPLVGISIPTIMGALTLPAFIAAAGLLAHKGWGRILGIVVGFLNLPGFPMGTIVGGYTIYVLMQDNAKSYFDSPERRLEASPRPV